VEALRTQVDEQESSLKAQEEEVMSKQKELNDLRAQEMELEVSVLSMKKEIEKMTNKQQETLLYISQIEELQDQEHHMTEVITAFDSAISAGDATTLSESSLMEVHPNFNDPYYMSVGPQTSPVKDALSPVMSPVNELANANGILSDSASENTPKVKDISFVGGQDPFAQAFGGSRPNADPFAVWDNKSNPAPVSQTTNDPFGGDAFVDKPAPPPPTTTTTKKDSLSFDVTNHQNHRHLNYHHHTNQSSASTNIPSSSLSSINHTPITSEIYKNSNFTPVLPPKKAKQPPPRPAPPKTRPVKPPPPQINSNNNPTATNDPFSGGGGGWGDTAASKANKNSGGFADFANFAEFEKYSSATISTSSSSLKLPRGENNSSRLSASSSYVQHSKNRESANSSTIGTKFDPFDEAFGSQRAQSGPPANSWGFNSPLGSSGFGSQNGSDVHLDGPNDPFGGDYDPFKDSRSIKEADEFSWDDEADA
ncbi:hypothetical protein Anas_08224, partial [Armadillidium nasatum]